MKQSLSIAVYVLAELLLAIVFSCKKTHVTSQTLPPEPVAFELINQEGRSLVTSKKDVVSITYINSNGTTVNLPPLTIMKLQVSGTDTTASPNFNGLFITDNSGMADAELAAQPNPSKTFNLSLNGKTLGTIYLDYWPFINAYPALSSSALTFDNTPALMDRNAGHVVLELFQTAN